jgi:hypothetical protein
LTFIPFLFRLRSADSGPGDTMKETSFDGKGQMHVRRRDEITAWACLTMLIASTGVLSEDEPNKIVTLSPSLRFDAEKEVVWIDAEVVLTEGSLELLLCPKRTKEHESILAAEIAPRQFQLALLGVGAVPGATARFEPSFEPPRGQKIRIQCEYERDGQRVRDDARDWIRSPARTNSPQPKFDFVFAGSRFLRIPGESRVRWLGDDGDVICVANFPGSIVDVNLQSTASNDALLFEAWTDRIPPKGTKVRVILQPLADGPTTPKPPAQSATKP